MNWTCFLFNHDFIAETHHFVDRRGRERTGYRSHCSRCGVSPYAPVYQQLTLQDHWYCWRLRFYDWIHNRLPRKPSGDDELPF